MTPWRTELLHALRAARDALVPGAALLALVGLPARPADEQVLVHQGPAELVGRAWSADGVDAQHAPGKERAARAESTVTWGAGARAFDFRPSGTDTRAPCAPGSGSPRSPPRQRSPPCSPTAAGFWSPPTRCPAAADAIVVLAGSHPRSHPRGRGPLPRRRGAARRRDPRAAAARRGPAPGPRRTAARERRADGRRAPPSRRAARGHRRAPPPRPRSTESEAATIARWACARRLRSLVVVTSRYHSRRARLILRRALGPGVAARDAPVALRRLLGARAGGRIAATRRRCSPSTRSSRTTGCASVGVSRPAAGSGARRAPRGPTRRRPSE